MAFLQLQRLMECAQAIEGGHLDVADSLLASIQSLVSEEASESTRKVVQYCAEALVRRVYGIRPLLFEPWEYMSPLSVLAETTTQDAIADALNPGNKRLHIINLSIMSPIWRWTDFIDSLKDRYGGLQSVLITSVTPKRSSEKWVQNVGGDDLELRQLIYNSPDDIVKCFSKLRRKRKDEMVVVNWGFTIRKLLAQDGAIERVLSKVKDLEADIMVIVEQEANLNSPDLSNRLEQSLQYYSAVLQSLKPEDDTFMSRETYFRRQMGNVVACEGIDRVERIESFDQWQHRLSQAGFGPVPLRANLLIFSLSLDLDYLEIKEKDGHIQLRWHGLPLAVASAWKFTNPPQSSSGLCEMQDRVDDSEEMARSSESEDVEENDPSIMANRYLWRTQGSAMNRIAASANLFDILEYLCHLYKLPAAVTWISDNRGGNTKSSEKCILCIDYRGGNTNSNEKRILCIDYSACYALTLSMDEYINRYAHHPLEEGQGVAGKALQSNFHIQHDVYEPDDFYDYDNESDFYDSDNESNGQNQCLRASFAIRLTSTHSCKDDYVLEFFLPYSMEDTSERELLISKVLRTLQEICFKSWKVWVTEQNEASGFEVRLDDERMSSIPQEVVSSILQLSTSDRENEFMTNINQAGETHQPLEQDVQEQSAIAAPALNDENASLIVDGGLQSTNNRRNELLPFNPTSTQAGETHEPLEQDVQEQSAIAAPALNDENASLIVDGGLWSTNNRRNELLPFNPTSTQAGETHEPLEQDVQEQSAIAAPALNDENASLIVDGGLWSTNNRRNELLPFNPTSTQAGETHEPLEQDVQEQSAIAAPALNDENASLIVDGGLWSTNNRRNELLPFNPTSTQAGETHEPLEQDVQEQSAIAAPALNDENASLIVDGGLRSTNNRRNELLPFNPTSTQAGETHEPLEQDVHEQSVIAAPTLNDENASLIVDGSLQSTNKRRKKQSAITAPALNDENVSLIVDGGLESTNKRKRTSKVWVYFDKHRGKNGEEWATCKHCKNTYRAESKERGTSNLLKHLKKCPPRRQDEAEQQPLIFETGGSSTSVIQRNSVINQERSHLDIETMIINHGYPLDTVQHEFFEIFVKNLQPMFALQSKVDVEANVLAIYRQEKEKLIEYFDSLSCLMSLTLELWSSNDKMITYYCLTVHFIDDGWQLKKKILAFRNLQYNYDTGTVHEFIKSVLAEWRINKNVHFILLDITPPKEHMIGELRSKVSDKAPLVHGHLFCVPSYDQILSLLVQAGFSEIRSLLYKIRECIEYVNGSSLGRQRFQEAVNNGSLHDKEMPFQDVPARWDTTFLMLERSSEFREAFNHLEQLDRDFKVNPSAEEWNKATSICECLKELHKSTSKFPTTPEGYFLSVRDVYKNLLKWKQSEHVNVRSTANRMKGKFDEYWGEASLALGISVVLNPSFKSKLVEYGYWQIYGSEYSLHFSNFLDNVTDVYNKYDQGPSSSAMVDESLCPTSSISFEEWHSRKNELDQYLEQPLEKLDKDGNVLLAWWQQNAQKFPILGKMARDFLAIPESTAISKSSEVMKMASAHDGVHPEIAEALICGKDWLDSR